MTDTTSLGFIYPEDDDYGDTNADVPRAVRELAESIDDFLNDSLDTVLEEGAAVLFSSVGYQNSWVDGAEAAGFAISPTGRVHLQGTVTDGAVDTVVVTLPSGFGTSFTQRWVVPHRDNDFAIVQLSGFDLSVIFAPSSPVTESVYLDGINWKATA